MLMIVLLMIMIMVAVLAMNVLFSSMLLLYLLSHKLINY